MLQPLNEIYQKIEETKQKIQRTKDIIQCVAVTKTVPKEKIIPFLQHGHRHFGENRVQEATQKYLELKKLYPDLKLHLIGPLQSNKVEEAVSLFDVIHTIDRDKIAKLLAQEMTKQKKKIDCFLQVNIGLEPQKYGLSPYDIEPFLEKCQQEYKLNIIGLMAIPPKDENPGPYFAYMQQLQKKCQLPSLSMGMSNDFEMAITFGADYVRVGRQLFRPSS